MHGPSRSVIEHPLRDDPATTQSEINELGDGVRWSFAHPDAWPHQSRPIMPAVSMGQRNTSLI